MSTIGFIGLGHMGLPMAINLLNTGHHVTGYDLQTDAMDALVKAGGHAADSLTLLAKNQSIIITMLQKGDQVKKVCMGADGLFNKVSSKETLFIDCSSIDVPSSRALHWEAKKAGITMVDAPVSGGVAGAQAATLTFMVGGEKTAFERVTPLLSAMGKKIIHTGDGGSGQAAKICNNMILGIAMIGVSEAFILAEKLGLSAKKLHEVVTNSSGDCWVMDRYVPVPDILDNVPANRDYQPGFTSTMMLKDLCLSQQAAKEEGISTPLAAHATAIYQQFIEQGMGEKDFSAIIQAIHMMS